MAAATLSHNAHISLPKALWTPIRTSIQNSTAAAGRAMSSTFKGASSSVASGYGALEDWAHGVGRRATSKTAAVAELWGRGVAAVSKLGSSVRMVATAGRGRGGDGVKGVGSALADLARLPREATRRVVSRGGKVWGLVVQSTIVARDGLWGKAGQYKNQASVFGTGRVNSTMAQKPHWARRLASALAR